LPRCTIQAGGLETARLLFHGVAAPNSREGYVRKPAEELREMLTQMQTTASQVLRE